ncbi:peptide YY [Bifidobacterium pseudolongum subsp. pseudolongum]|nr:peptide YY [Bifidobacterium pseudolongum subsp. pseudolongum]
MRSCGTSGITTRFQELFRCMGQVGHALLTRSPLSPRQQAARDPVRLACVKHAASVHPEPESNPPQKTFMESQQTALKKKKDGPSLKERTVTQKPRHPSNPLGYHTGGHRTGNQEPQATPTRMRPMASSTVHTIEFSNHQTHPQPNPGQPGKPRAAAREKLTPQPPPTQPTGVSQPTTYPQNPTNTTTPTACHNNNRAPHKINLWRRAEQHRNNETPNVFSPS